MTDFELERQPVSSWIECESPTLLVLPGSPWRLCPNCPIDTDIDTKHYCIKMKSKLTKENKVSEKWDDLLTETRTPMTSNIIISHSKVTVGNRICPLWKWHMMTMMTVQDDDEQTVVKNAISFGQKSRLLEDERASRRILSEQGPEGRREIRCSIATTKKTGK